jgi:hypothetical protein
MAKRQDQVKGERHLRQPCARLDMSANPPHQPPIFIYFSLKNEQVED